MSKKLLVVMLSVIGIFALTACEKKTAPTTEAPAAAPAAEAPVAAPAAPATDVPAAPAAEAPAVDKK